MAHCSACTDLMKMPFCYFYDDAWTAHKQCAELIACGFDAGVMMWGNHERFMVTFDFHS